MAGTYSHVQVRLGCLPFSRTFTLTHCGFSFRATTEDCHGGTETQGVRCTLTAYARTLTIADVMMA